MDTAQTPMMRQWHACKEQAKGAVLLFRLGDFYEAFHDDAELLTRELEITLTKRQGTPMAGVPCHSAQGYIDRLVAKGYRVAIAEQTEEASKTKKLVNRQVTRIVTPGTAVESSLVSEKANHFMVSLAQVGRMMGLVTLELSTSQFQAAEFDSVTDLKGELARIQPAELLVSERIKERYAALLEELGIALTVKPDWWFDHESAREALGGHFGVRTLDGFGLKGMVAAINAAGGLVTYLTQELGLDLSHVTKLTPYLSSDYVALDPTTQNNLMLISDRRTSVLGVLDRTRTPMGSRLLREWVRRPLTSTTMINRRQELVTCLHANVDPSEALSHALQRIRDIERLSMKVSAGLDTPRGMRTLGDSLAELPPVQQLLGALPQLTSLAEQITCHDDLASLIHETLSEEPPARLSDGGVIREGVSEELDELRRLQRDGKAWIAAYQTQVRQATGIKTLKVGYNRVFGYYLEVRKGQTDLMPDAFVRRQTLTNAERYVSPELKNYENKIFSAEERVIKLENQLYNELRSRVVMRTQTLLATARALAELDTLNSLAMAAREHGYHRPIVDDSPVLHIEAGRHPVVEAADRAVPFMPNDTEIDGDETRLLLLTGPNMAGKSTYIRQVALITLMAQMGSFVPARSAHIGVVDRVFTRIGAGDDLTRGQSTFMVEMAETANILHNATDRSLIILDEVGRGTSTYDGVSIAWAIVEHLLLQSRSRTLFATHYHELTQLEGQVSGAVNYNIAVQEQRGQVIFLHKIVRGAADQSYGIHVGRLAGLPKSVLSRAQEILRYLESSSTHGRLPRKATAQAHPKTSQLSLFR